MKTFIKTISTVISILLIVLGLTALFTIDNAQGITGLIAYAAVMILGISGGIYLLTLMYPELLDLSEFDGDDNSIFEEYEREIAELREHNLLLIKRYSTFKSILVATNAINDSNKENYPNLYYLLYEEDLVGGENTIKEGSLEQVDKGKEDYN